MGKGVGVKPFDQLAQREQMRRLIDVAKVALRKYSIDVKRVRLLTQQTNTLYRVDANDGRHYMLRVCAIGEHTLRDHQIEAMWLKALASEPDIRVPRQVATRDGETIVHVATEKIPEGRRCMLFGWVPGRPLAQAASLANYEKLGVLLARLHRQAATLRVPADMRPLCWHKTFYSADPVVVYAPSHAHLFAPAHIEMIRQVEAMVDAELASMCMCGQPHFIHGDLHTNNVHVHKGELYAIDFEDVMWGFPAQDIAVSLYAARYHRDDYAAVRDALQHGYETVAIWPIASDHQLDVLLAARMLFFFNYRLCRGGVDLRAYVPGMLARVERFLQNVMA
jgi:Ser/Thr protein kinase RdoA (MazF antagonist)